MIAFFQFVSNHGLFYFVDGRYFGMFFCDIFYIFVKYVICSSLLKFVSGICNLFGILATWHCGCSNRIFCYRVSGFHFLAWWDNGHFHMYHFKLTSCSLCIWWDRRSLNQWPNMYLFLDISVCFVIKETVVLGQKIFLIFSILC